MKIRSRIDYEDWLRENEDFSDANGYNILDPKKALQCTVFQWDNPRDKRMELSFLVLVVYRFLGSSMYGFLACVMCGLLVCVTCCFVCVMC